jgi:glycosyltransferase involved in cell wall biosynthesis
MNANCAEVMRRTVTRTETAPGTSEGRFRFAAVISHPVQHYVPFFREMARRPEFQVKVFYACDWGVKPYHDPGFNSSFAWDVDLVGGYDHEFLPMANRPRDMGFWEIDAPIVCERLATFRPHAVWIHGYGHRIYWRAAAWATRRAAILHFGDSELIHNRSWFRRALKAGLLRWHFRRCDAFITIGDNNDAYYRHYGVSPARIFRGACPIDVARFRGAIQAPIRPSRAEIRVRYGFPPFDLVALWVGKLQSSKRPADFVAAMAKLAREGVTTGGLIVGDGPLRSDIERQIRELRLTERVRVTGFVNQADLPLVFDAGDLLVTTSGMDPHPLVVTESMAAGLPVVASDRVGCVGATDTARPGVNALVYPCGDVQALAGRIRQLASDVDLRSRLGKASYEIATGQEPATTARAVLRSLVYLGARGQYDWSDVSSATWDQISADAQLA